MREREREREREDVRKAEEKKWFNQGANHRILFPDSINAVKKGEKDLTIAVDSPSK